MDVKIAAVMIIAALFGGAIGYGFTYLGYHPRIEALQDQIHTMSGVFENLHSVMTELNTSVTQFATISAPAYVNASIEDLQNEVSNLAAVLSAMNTTSPINMSQIDAIRTDLARLNATLIRVQAELVDAHDTLARVNATVTDIDDVVSQVETALIELAQNVTAADVQGQLISVYTELGGSVDRHQVEGVCINFGTQVANNTRINLTWILDSVDFVYKTIELGVLPGHSIRVIETMFWFECSGRSITFSYNITWDNS